MCFLNETNTYLKMKKSFKNYALSIVAALDAICFVVSIVLIITNHFPLQRKVFVIAVALLSFFTTLLLLMQIKSGKSKEQI